MATIVAALLCLLGAPVIRLEREYMLTIHFGLMESA